MYHARHNKDIGKGEAPIKPRLNLRSDKFNEPDNGPPLPYGITKNIISEREREREKKVTIDDFSFQRIRPRTSVLSRFSFNRRDATERGNFVMLID